jgi:hypothetical protein
VARSIERRREVISRLLRFDLYELETKDQLQTSHLQ